MALQEIPLTSDGAQELSVVIEDIAYVFFVSYNTRMGYWTANITQDGATIVNGIGLVGGVDIVQQYTFDLKNLWTINATDSKEDAGPENLGTDVLLLKVSADVIEELSSEPSEETVFALTL